MQDIEKKEFLMDYSIANDHEIGDDLSFIEEIKFDDKNNFVIGFGGTKFFLLNMISKLGKIYEVDNLKFNCIKDLSFDSNDSYMPSDFFCIVACNMKYSN